MTITNGYTTLPELRLHLQDMATYTAATISLTAATKTVADSANGLKRFKNGTSIRVSGSTSNDGVYVIASGGNTAGSFVTIENLTDEAASASITIRDISNDEEDDSILENAVEAASRWIDHWTGRRFYAASETRYYTAEYADTLFVDDLLSVTTLKTDDDGDRTYENTWATADYDLMPFNATLESQPEPFTWLEITPEGDFSFATIAKGVEIVGSFGYASTTPPAIVKACLLYAARLVKRKDVLFGVLGPASLGQIRLDIKPDKDVVALLRTYLRTF